MKQEPTEAALAAVGISRLKPWGGRQAFCREGIIISKIRDEVFVFEDSINPKMYKVSELLSPSTKNDKLAKFVRKAIRKEGHSLKVY
ncbi:MAG: hypothetical protein LBR25_09830 [Erysipelotrichaceae bacterium]|jgi:hypothetical protein|nr:hypothetical protein [Erysipelotrichaceae bacterium]